MNKILFAACLLTGSISFGLPMEGLIDLSGQSAKYETEKNIELVVFWATWCPDCKSKITDELPKLQSSKDINVVLINTEKEVERVKQYLEKQNIKLTVFMDPEKKLRKELKVFAVPAWAVYKRENKKKPWSLVESDGAFDNEKVNKALGAKYL